MHIAIEGCSHGELDIIYQSIQKLENVHKFKIDFLLCCGDFQSVRNESDLKCMAVPPKYMQMHDFHRYYSGEKKAPLLTLFIGGNHEASNYLQELPYGGWVAPNIYYLGYAGVVCIGGLRIGGLSGIYKAHDYLTGHYEKTPYTRSSIRSVYHIRNLEVFRLKQLSGKMDIVMSHDWPRGICYHGNMKELLEVKRHLEVDIKSSKLGSRPAEDLIKKLKPAYWFSGHLHVKFSALMKHQVDSNTAPSVTKFLALDKCLPHRKFLQVLELPQLSEELQLCHDAEWLTILRLTNHLISASCERVYMPGPGSQERYDFTPTSEEIEETISMMGGNLRISESDFKRTVESFDESKGLPDMNIVPMPIPAINPQTTTFCSKLGIDDPLKKKPLPQFSPSGNGGLLNKSELNLTDMSTGISAVGSFNVSCNPEDINLSDDDEFELCKDEESGDFILEVPLASTEDSPKSNVNCNFGFSPISGSKLSTPTRLRSYSPMSSSPRIGFEDTPRSSFSLSKPKNSTGTPSPLEMREDEEFMERTPVLVLSDDGTAAESFLTSSSVSVFPLSGSSQSEEESDAGKCAQKRESSCDETEGVEVTPETGSWSVEKNKKLKRRNVSIYAATDNDI